MHSSEAATIGWGRRQWRVLLVALCGVLAVALAAGPGQAAGPFDGGWTLQSDVSSLNFQSVKKGTKVEVSKFATFSGDIAPDGTATIQINLESVDTGIDLRNVRMRFLFFESFRFPVATVTATIDPAMIADLPTLRRKRISLPYVLDLHGVKKISVADVVVSLLGDDTVAIASPAPITIATADHDLDVGVAKLEEAAGVSILRSGAVTFDFLFQRNIAAPVTEMAAAPAPAPETPLAPAPEAPAPAAPAPEAPATGAVETAGAFDAQACIGRFEILSRTGNIYFRSGSSTLDPDSAPLLQALYDIVSRCPGMVIEVAGHTDSDGGAAANQRLSEARARSVADFLVGHGIAPDRIVSVGYGEDRPVAANDTSANKARNRRIEFSVVRP